MDFKKLFFLFSLVPVFLFFIGCSEQEKNNTENTYYVDLVNFNNDSLKQNLSEKIFGKVSFYRNDKLEILSVNYVTENFTKMHFFKNAAELEKKIKPETKKVRIEFGGTFTRDSITYSLQKFIYRNNQWIKTSDMGFIKGVNTYMRAKQFAVDQFAKQILNEAVVYTYN